MGLTRYASTKVGMTDIFYVEKTSPKDLVIALAGNPNTGKSTVFNALTGLHQHTGNWPGKTVANARGNYSHRDKNFILVDLPGTYSLLASSVEEQIARDFICFGRPDATVVVADATCLERNLNLILQVIELTDNVVVCVNLIDEAKKKKIEIDILKLQLELGVPVVGTAARSGVGLKDLLDAVYNVSTGKVKTSPKRVLYPEDIESLLEKVIPEIDGYVNNTILARWLALRFIDGDKTIIESIKNYMADFDDTNKEKAGGLIN